MASKNNFNFAQQLGAYGAPFLLNAAKGGDGERKDEPIMNIRSLALVFLVLGWALVAFALAAVMC